MSPQRFAALVLVAQNPGLRQGLLADAMGLHRSGGMRLTDWLCEQGWVQRADDPLDRRSWTVHPTPAGLALLESVTAQVRTHDEALLAALGDEGPQLRRLLDRLAAAANALVHRFRKSFTFQPFGSRSSSIGSERVGHSSRRCL